MYSFDIFDTLITRKTAVPDGIFAIMQSELRKEDFASIPVSIRNNFYRLRIAAEKLARYSYQNGETEDVTLAQIYDAFAIRGELTGIQRKQLVCLECDVEYQECVPIEKNVMQVKKLLANGEKVILISDMYLPKEQIYKMLSKADPVLENLQLYVSGDCKKRKRTGAIYRFAMEQSHLNGAECVHTGDNERMDAAAAEKVGIHARLSWFPGLLPIEKDLLDQTPGDVWLNRVIGCSRRARLNLGEEMAKKDGVLVGTSVGGILLNSYMQWVMRSVLARGIRRLYFMAPDGYVLKRVADIQIQKTGLAVETCYCHGTEYTMRERDFSDDRFAFAALSERCSVQQHFSDFYKGCFRTFLFSLDRLPVTDQCNYFVFYPGRIDKRDVLEQFCTISENRKDYLAGIEAFTNLFCEDGHMIVQSENAEQIYRILNYMTERRNSRYDGKRI